MQATATARLLAVLLAALVAVAVPVAGASAAQHVSHGVKRIFADTNANLDIDGVDDQRVDVDIALLDAGIDLDHPDLNVVGAVNCLTGICESDPSNDDDGLDSGTEPDLDGDDRGGHGTMVAGIVAAIDNGFGGVGVAPGARLWSVQVNDEVARSVAEENASNIAGVEWVTETRTDSDPDNDVDVAMGKFGCAPPEAPAIHQCTAQEEAALEDAIAAAIAEGIVFVSPAGNWGGELPAWGQSSFADVLHVSGIADFDGAPGGLVDPPRCTWPGLPDSGEAAGEEDDSHADNLNWGAGIDVVAPASCIGFTSVGGGYWSGGPARATSMAYGHAAGAAAILASSEQPTTASGVDDIHDAVIAEGNLGYVDDGGPEDKGDGIDQPLVDLNDEGVFDPATVAGCDVASAPEAESDVNGDGRSDLVTLRPDGVAYVHGGGTGHVLGTGVESFRGSDGIDTFGTIDSAQYIGSGHYVVDVADVTGDGCADLVTLSSNGSAYVHPGRPGKTFGTGVASFGGTMKPALLAAGGHEPIAVADVNGDGRSDLVTFDDGPRNLMVYPGEADGTFDSGITADSNVFSALHTASGEYFVDVVDVDDVTDDGRADLVSMTTWDDLWVRPGQADGTFGDPVGSAWTGVTANPVMNDGLGYEPIGVGDVTGDGKADLALQKDGTFFVYRGQAGGTFLSPVSSFTGLMPSTMLGASSGVETAGVVDVNGDGYSDIVGAYRANNSVQVAKGQSSGQFVATQGSLIGAFETTQHFTNQDATGNEIAIEKPAFKRRGCTASGCHPGAAVPSGVGVESRSTGLVDLYARFSTGEIKQRWWTVGTGWSTWGGHGSPPGGSASEPAVTSRTSNDVNLFVRGADQSLWQKSWTSASGWSSWEPLGGVVRLKQAAVAPTSDSIHVFARGANDSLWRRRWSATGGWAKWEPLDPMIATGVAATSRSTGSVDLVVRDAAGVIQQRSWSSAGGWSSWTSLGTPSGGATSAPTVVSRSSDNLEVFVRGSDQGLWQRSWSSGSGWSAWTSRGGTLQVGPAAVSPASDAIQVFARDTSAALMVKRWSATTGWGAWELLP